MPMTRHQKAMLRRKDHREEVIFWAGTVSMLIIAVACAYATYQALTIY